MTKRFATFAALAIGAALSFPLAAQAGEWFQPPGSTEVGRATFPDGSTNYEFRMPDGALCDACKKRRDETEVAWRFARRENVDRNRAEYERVARILSESDCGE